MGNWLDEYPLSKKYFLEFKEAIAIDFFGEYIKVVYALDSDRQTQIFYKEDIELIEAGLYESKSDYF